MDYLKLCFNLSSTYLKTKMEHRTQFIMDQVSWVITYLSSYLVIWMFVNKFGSINGWTFWEMMLILNLNLFSYGIASIFFFVPMVWLGGTIQSGQLDSYLLRPMGLLQFLVLGATDNTFFGIVGMSTAAIAYTCAHLAIQWTSLKVVFLVLALIGGTLIQSASLLAGGSLSFWTNSPNSFRNAIFDNARNFVDYPVSIYGKVIQSILTFGIPFAFVGFYPAQYLLGKGPVLFHPLLQFGTPVVGIVGYFLAYQLWKAGVNRYEGTGS